MLHVYVGSKTDLTSQDWLIRSYVYVQHFRLRSFTDIVLLYVCWTVGLFNRSDMLVLSMSALSIPSLALRDINTTLGLSTFPRHVMAWFGGRASSFRAFNRVYRWFYGISPSCNAVLMSSKESETAVYGCNPALLKFYQCRVDFLQS